MSVKPNLAHSVLFEQFYANSLDQVLEQAATVSIEQKLLALFNKTASSVPAYQTYLQEHQFDPQAITTLAHYESLPLMTKAAYMQRFPLAQRCYGGNLFSADRIAVSSGSTGQPGFWPRSAADELSITVRFEQVFADSFQAEQRTTLAVVCFALGNWVGGIFTTSCCWHLARKGYPMMVATPGNNKAEIFRVVKELAPQFEQTVLLGYPPFIKDVLDAGRLEGIDWAAFQTKLVFAGEVFSEEWRELVSRTTGADKICFASASLYGTADGGVLGNESPFSIAVRRWLAQQPDAAHALFGEARLPTLVQYDPRSRYFEVHNGTLVVSGDSSLPLVRYHIADKGGIFSYDQLWAFLSEHGVQTCSALGLPENFTPRTLPFVYVFGRVDFTVSYYGANIYPENITVGLEQAEFTSYVSGKFVLETQEDLQGDKYLLVTIELLPGVVVSEALGNDLAKSIREQVVRLNSEFANYTPAERQTPKVVLKAFGDNDYFPVGVKHRYTRRKSV